MSTLVGRANLAAANTVFETTCNEVLSGQAEGYINRYASKFSADGTSVDLLMVDGLPQVRQWTGSKTYYDLRAYKLNVARAVYEASISQKRVDVDGDRTGIIGKRLAAFARRAPSMYNKLVVDALVANTALCYDGQALLANSHPNTAGNADNLEAAALTLALLKTAIQAIELRTDELGEPLGLYPDFLLCGPAQRTLALQLTGSVRPVAVGTSSALDAATVGGAVVLENYVGGELDVGIDPRITGNAWFVMATKGEAKPYYLAEFRAPEAISQTAMDDEARFTLDEYRWSIEFDLGLVPGAWQAIHGSVT